MVKLTSMNLIYHNLQICPYYFLEFLMISRRANNQKIVEKNTMLRNNE